MFVKRYYSKERIMAGLKGSKSESNLYEAFAGESQANPNTWPIRHASSTIYAPPAVATGN